MQMLHTRRKAEIEILSSSFVQRPAPQSTNRTDLGELCSGKSGSLLLRYLIWKINKALEG